MNLETSRRCRRRCSRAASQDRDLASILAADPPGQPRVAPIDVRSLIEPVHRRLGSPRAPTDDGQLPIDEVVDLLRTLRLPAHARR